MADEKKSLKQHLEDIETQRELNAWKDEGEFRRYVLVYAARQTKLLWMIVWLMIICTVIIVVALRA